MEVDEREGWKRDTGIRRSGICKWRWTNGPLGLVQTISRGARLEGVWGHDCRRRWRFPSRRFRVRAVSMGYARHAGDSSEGNRSTFKRMSTSKSKRRTCR